MKWEASYFALVFGGPVSGDYSVASHYWQKKRKSRIGRATEWESPAGSDEGSVRLFVEDILLIYDDEFASSHLLSPLFLTMCMASFIVGLCVWLP